MKKILVFALVFLLCFCWAAAPMCNAFAAEVVVTGATVMTMALLGSLGILTINAAGYSDALVQAAYNAGQNAKEFGQALFASYARTQNITAGQAVQLAAQGTSYLEDGTIIFNKAMSDLMSGFVKWAWDADDGPELINYAESVTSGNSVESKPDNSAFSNIVVPFDYGFEWNYNYPGGANNFHYSGDAKCAYGVVNNPYARRTTIFYATEIPNSTINYISQNSSYEMSLDKSYTYDNKTVYYNFNALGWAATDNNLSPVNFSVWNGENVAQAAWLMVFGSAPGETTYPGVDTNIFDGIPENSPTDVNILDPETFVSVPDTNVTGGVVDVQDWIDGLTDLVVEGVAEVPVEVDGVPTTTTLEGTEVSDIPVSVESANSVSGAGSIANSTSVDGLEDYTIELVDFFPFCIPFDIYDMLSLFAATREAPVVNWRFYVPNVIDETIVLDFSIFDPVAQVLRTVELIAAAIGLAFVTKKLIQGGD